jgi:hypothetical protein
MRCCYAQPRIPADMHSPKGRKGVILWPKLVNVEHVALQHAFKDVPLRTKVPK